MPSELPKITYTTEAGERRRVRYERVSGAPWNVERQVDRWDGRTWMPWGGERLTELVVEGQHRAAVTITERP